MTKTNISGFDISNQRLRRFEIDGRDHDRQDFEPSNTPLLKRKIEAVGKR